MNRLLFALSALLILAAACNKAADGPTSAQEDLRSGTWTRTSGRYTYKDPRTRGDSVKVYDTLEPACRRDNSLTFKVAFVGTVNMGAKKCSAGDPDTKEFQWQITNDEKRISIYNADDYFQTGTVDADIITRTLGYLAIRYNVVRVDSIYHTRDTLIYNDVFRR